MAAAVARCSDGNSSPLIPHRSQVAPPSAHGAGDGLAATLVYQWVLALSEGCSPLEEQASDTATIEVRNSFEGLS